MGLSSYQSGLRSDSVVRRAGPWLRGGGTRIGLAGYYGRCRMIQGGRSEVRLADTVILDKDLDWLAEVPRPIHRCDSHGKGEGVLLV